MFENIDLKSNIFIIKLGDFFTGISFGFLPFHTVELS